MKITVDGLRYNLSSMVDLGIETREKGGRWIKSVHFGISSHRIIVEHGTAWQGEKDHYEVLSPCKDKESLHHLRWTDTMTLALELCKAEHDDMLEEALDQHQPALEG